MDPSSIIILLKTKIIEKIKTPYLKKIEFVFIWKETKKGTRLNQIMSHTLGLFHGQAGSSFWKRYLSENMCVRDADVKKIDHIMDKITFNHIASSAS